MSATKREGPKVTFIGAGNMTEALVRGILSGGICARADVSVADVRPERREYFAQEFGVRSLASNREAVEAADVAVLAVKPQMIQEVLNDLSGTLRIGTLIISIAAGIPIRRIEEALGEGTRVIRVMPNTPALVQAGVSALCGGRWATEQDRETAARLLGAVGLVVPVGEQDMDAVTAVSGSGPAYVFFLAEIMLEAAQRLRLPPETARDLVTTTLEGAVRLMKQTGLPPAELRARVTSKGGTTEAALNVLREKGVFEGFVQAILAARQRAAELSKA